MRKLTFDTLPGAIAEILERLDRVEQLLIGKTPSKAKVKKMESKGPTESIDVTEAAKMLNSSVASVYSYVKNKKIPFEKKSGKLAFSPTALETWKQEKNKSKKKAGSNNTGKKGISKKVINKKDADKKDNSITTGKLITPLEAQKLFNKPLASIYYIIKTRKLQEVEKKGRAKYYLKDELSKAFKGKQKKSDKRPS
jgi:predicted DNA-binding transcriptional regulator AlpA